MSAVTLMNTNQLDGELGILDGKPRMRLHRNLLYQLTIAIMACMREESEP